MAYSGPSGRISDAEFTRRFNEIAYRYGPNSRQANAFRGRWVREGHASAAPHGGVGSVPVQPAVPATPATPATPGVPAHLNPEQEQARIDRESEIAQQRIVGDQDWADLLSQDAATNARIIQEYQQGVRRRGEELASRGLSAGGVRAQDLSDIERNQTLAQQEWERTRQRAQSRHLAVTQNLNERLEATQRNFAVMAAQNMVAGTPATPGTPAQPARPGIRTPAAQPKQRISGPPPGPDYVWDGTKWVKRGVAYARAFVGQTGKRGGPSGSPPSPRHFWDGTRWRLS